MVVNFLVQATLIEGAHKHDASATRFKAYMFNRDPTLVLLWVPLCVNGSKTNKARLAIKAKTIQAES